MKTCEVSGAVITESELDSFELLDQKEIGRLREIIKKQNDYIYLLENKIGRAALTTASLLSVLDEKEETTAVWKHP